MRNAKIKRKLIPVTVNQIILKLMAETHIIRKRKHQFQHHDPQGPEITRHALLDSTVFGFWETRGTINRCSYSTLTVTKDAERVLTCTSTRHKRHVWGIRCLEIVCFNVQWKGLIFIFRYSGSAQDQQFSIVHLQFSNFSWYAQAWYPNVLFSDCVDTRQSQTRRALQHAILE